MSKSHICRVCLCSDRRMHTITNTVLQEIWERLTRDKFNSDNSKPVLVCFICCAQLRKCHQLLQRALKAEELLTIYNGLELSQKLLSLTTCQTFKFDYNYGIKSQYSLEFKGNEVEVNSVEEVKKEDKDENEEMIKEEHEVIIKEEEESNHKEDIDDVESSTDSDDNVPLKSISQKKKAEREVCKRREKKPRKIILKKIDKGRKLDVTEIVLTKQDQIDELMKRCKTQNYIYSPYKCGMCFKGFIDARAYENHKDKHSESNGGYECDICHMRYKTARHLKTHRYSAHEKHYKCNKCSFISHTPNKAREHEQWHEGYTYECKLCSQKFRKPTSYLTHMRTRHPTENVCNLCGESFVGKMGLMLHKSKMHRREDKTDSPEDPTSDRFCSECNMQFSTLHAWKRHILSSVKHTLANQNGTQCKICHQNVTRGNMAAHMKEHDKKMRKAQTLPVSEVKMASVVCNQCGAKFLNGATLRTHVKRMHLGVKYNKNIVCEVCGKNCTSNAALIYHQRSHTGERPYECTVCNKRFRDTNQLRIHTRTHTGERPYCCNHCGKRFCQKPALNRHYRVHTGAKPYKCQYCSKVFSQSNSLKGHIKTVHLKMPSNNRRRSQKNVEIVEEGVETQELQKEIVVQ